MSGESLQQRTGWLGLACFALIVGAGLVAPLWDFPDTSASSSQLSAYINAHREASITALLLYGAGMSLFIAFAAGVWQWLRRLRPTADLATSAFALASGIFVALIFAGFVPQLVLAYRAPYGEAAHALYDLCFGLLAISGLPTAVALWAYGALTWRARGLVRWSGRWAFVAAAAHLVVAASFIPTSGFLALEGAVIVAVPATLFLWILIASVALLRASPQQEVPTS